MKLAVAAGLMGLTVLAGCATEMSVPVTGFIGNESAAGQSTARLGAPGDFWVQTLSGLRCEGTYDSSDVNPTIAIPARCNDGRTAQLLATRNTMTGGGTVIGRLSDGTEGRFVFGNLSFEQAFGGGGAQTMPYPGTM